jgi:hypothetical protein
MNTPLHDEKGRRVAFTDAWRVPRRPFAAPICHEEPAERISFRYDVFRCRSCGTRIAPERLHHRLMFRRNPFGASTPRDLVRVTRLTHRVKTERWTLL